MTLIPHLLPQNRGVIVSVPLEYNAKSIHQALDDYYRNETFVIILPIGNIPATHHVRGSNYCHIGVVPDNNSGRCILFSAIDNLVKGAAGQAVQCFNVSNGLKENKN